MIRYRNGNLLDSQMQTLVNTVNLKGVMGKGIALQFKERYPAMFAEYQAKCANGELRIGTLHLYHAMDHLVLNFPTKRHYRNNSRIDDIEKGLARLRATYAEQGITSLAVPALGCGNGGLDWNDIRPLIEHYLGDLPIEVEVYPPPGEKPDLGASHATKLDNDQPEEQSPIQMNLLDVGEPSANATKPRSKPSSARKRPRKP